MQIYFFILKNSEDWDTFDIFQICQCGASKINKKKKIKLTHIYLFNNLQYYYVPGIGLDNYKY